MAEIIMDIGTQGEITIEVNGAKGQSCLAETKDLEKDLGGQLKSYTPKPEMKEREEKTSNAGRRTVNNRSGR